MADPQASIGARTVGHNDFVNILQAPAGFSEQNFQFCQQAFALFLECFFRKAFDQVSVFKKRDHQIFPGRNP